MDRRNFAFDRTNFLLIAVGMAIVVIGFIMMSGGGSDYEHFDPNIFSTMRIKIAPVVCLAGFISIIYAVIRKPRDTEATGDDTSAKASTGKE